MISTIPVTIGETSLVRSGGSATFTTDEEGRFDVPALAVGRLTLEIIPSEEHPSGAYLDWDAKIEAGETTEIEIPLSRATKVSGTGATWIKRFSWR